jgi:hypothetical protein
MLKANGLRFADNTKIIAKNLESVNTLVKMTKDLFSSVRMQINPSKSYVTNIKKRKSTPKIIKLLDSSKILSLDENDCIKLLEINFKDKIVFDQKQFLINLENDLKNLFTSPLLKSDKKKINILNQYAYPKLIYFLQTTPVNLLQQPFLKRVNIHIRKIVREICALLVDTPIYYSILQWTRCS